MRILVDYRPALTARTGAGVYMHELVRAFTSRYDDEVTLFSSSWKGRLTPDLSKVLRARVVDRRIPVKVLNFLWHRWQSPDVEALAGSTDVVHAAHPLLIPTRRAAQVVTIHDLYFLDHPEDTRAEIRRDYPALARAHARRADAIITSSDHTKARVLELFGVEDDRLHVVRPGALQRVSGRAVEARRPDGPVLFLGTVERRKNLDVVADAYERLLGSGRRVPRLIVAGGEGPGGRQSLDRLAREPLRAVTEYRGYVSDAERESLLGAARLLVLPSWDEGFGLPALEAMAAGVPVIASNRGSLPEVLGDAAVLLPPDDAAAWAETIDRLAHDDMGLASHRQRGIARAATFTWDETASALRRAYEAAIAHRQARH